MRNETAISGTMAGILIVCLVLILVLVIGALFFGSVRPQEKSAFFLTEIGEQTLYNKHFITVFHQGGEAVFPGSAAKGGNRIGIYVINGTNTSRAEPDAGLVSFGPGTTLFLYSSGMNLYNLTTNGSALNTSKVRAVTVCPLSVRVIDENTKMLITQWNWTECIPTGPAPTVTRLNLSSGNRGWPAVRIISGTNFLAGATAQLNRSDGETIASSGCSYDSPTQLTCTFDLKGRKPSPPTYNVVVVNPDGKRGMRANAFTLNSPAPTLSSSTPNTGKQAATVTITRLAGNYFQPDAVVTYNNGTTSISLTGIAVSSPTTITGTLSIPAGAPVGPYSVTVTNTDTKTVTRTGMFTVTSNAPTITSITPASGNRGWPVLVTINGANYGADTTAKLNNSAYPDIPASSCSYVSAARIICSFSLAGVSSSPPVYNMVVINPDGQTAVRANAFTVNSPAPTISSSTPATGTRGTTVAITNLAGTNVQPGATVTYWRGATVIPLDPLTIVSRTSITGSLAIPAGAPTGAYNITLVNTDGRTVTRASGFTVYASPPPTISGIAPGTGARGAGVPVIVTGTNIQAGARVRLYNGTTQVYLAPTGTVTPPGTIATTFTVPATVLPGTMNVRITNTDGQYATLAGGYVLT